MQIPFHARCAGMLALFVLGGSPALAQAAPPNVIAAVILKVEGEGIANVRKRSGVMVSAGARGKVYVGDRVITDTRSAVYLMLTDGSILKVGFSSEFTLEKVENKRSYLSWLFRLEHGSIRALVEKIPTQETHLRVETQAGAIGVRGTEFVLVYDEGSSSSSLYMLEGLVTYGASGCETSHTCIDVRGGEASTMPKGATKPTTPVLYNVKDLFAVSKPASPGANAESRLSLFRDARRVQANMSQARDENALKKIVNDATTDLAAAQDRAIGRTKEQRDAMHAAIKNGTYDSTIAAADAYSSARGIFNGNSNGGAENLVAQAAAAKFRLGDAVKKADAAGLFLDKPANPPGVGSSASRTFNLRKNVDYDQSTIAKADKQTLAKTSDDYKDTLIYVEALAASQVPSGDTPKDAKPGAAAGQTAATCDSACEDARVAHEADIASEGTVAAFQDPAAATKASASPDAVPSKRGKGGLPGSVKTEFFKRTVPGNSCFRTQSKCSMQPCAGFSKSKKCKAGEMIEVCDNKQVPVRCDDSQSAPGNW